MRTAPALVTALLVAAALAGCAAPAKPSGTADPSGLGGTVRQTVGDDVVDTAGRTGLIDGIVINENGAVLRGAYVSVLKTSLSTTTSSSGQFLFKDVPIGERTLRVDLEGYRSLEAKVDVLEGKATNVEIVLDDVEDRGAGFREHVHDLWGDATEMELFNEPLTLSAAASCAAAAVLELGAKSGGCWDIPFRLPGNRIVPPGTRELVVTVHWEKTDHLKTVDLTYTPANVTLSGKLDRLKPGDSRPILMQPTMNDHGHSRYSVWAFTLLVHPKLADVVSFTEDNFYKQFVGPVRVKIVALKGIVLPEPAHARYWSEGPQLQLLGGNHQHKVNQVPAQTRNAQQSLCSVGSACFNITSGMIVPPGTTRLLVTLEWDWSVAQAGTAAKEKRLAIRTAATNPSTVSLADLWVPTPKEASAKKAEYELALNDDMPDAFYQKRSMWIFFVGNRGEERATEYRPDCLSACGGDLFRLTVVAVNDHWDEDLAAGRAG
jgi:hypothetical protein